jgi:hypothetical protein
MKQKFVHALTRVELANKRSFGLTVHIFHLVAIHIQMGLGMKGAVPNARSLNFGNCQYVIWCGFRVNPEKLWLK